MFFFFFLSSAYFFSLVLFFLWNTYYVLLCISAVCSHVYLPLSLLFFFSVQPQKKKHVFSSPWVRKWCLLCVFLTLYQLEFKMKKKKKRERDKMVFFPVRYRVASATALVLPRHEKACCLDACYSCFFTPHQGHGEVHTAFFFFFFCLKRLLFPIFPPSTV